MVDSPMWGLVMFDLPVETKVQRRNATQFRKFLIDHGFCMEQFSVYVKYWPTGGVDHALMRVIKANLPPAGSVRIVAITDRQWAKALWFQNLEQKESDPLPEQLTIF